MYIQEQENNLNVKNSLNKLFENFTLIILPEKTKGPFMTIHQAIKYSDIIIISNSVGYFLIKISRFNKKF